MNQDMVALNSAGGINGLRNMLIRDVQRSCNKESAALNEAQVMTLIRYTRPPWDVLEEKDQSFIAIHPNVPIAWVHKLVRDFNHDDFSAMSHNDSMVYFELSQNAYLDSETLAMLLATRPDGGLDMVLPTNPNLGESSLNIILARHIEKSGHAFYASAPQLLDVEELVDLLTEIFEHPNVGEMAVVTIKKHFMHILRNSEKYNHMTVKTAISSLSKVASRTKFKHLLTVEERSILLVFAAAV